MSQELIPLEPEAQHVSKVCEAFTLPLLSLLRNADDAKAAVTAALKDDRLLAEARRVNGRVQALAKPMGPDAVYRALQPCLILFDTPDFGREATTLTKAWITIYQDALARLPKEALEHAVSEWIANGKPYFPKPVELIKLAESKVGEVSLLAWRCRRIVEDSERIKPPEISPEERETVAAALRALAAEMAAKAREKEAAMRPPQRPTMDKHAMAEVLRRNAELFERQKDGAAPTSAELEAMLQA